VVATSLMANGIWSNSCQVQASLCGYEMIGRPPRGARGAMGEAYTTADGRAFILTTTNPARDWPLLARAVGHPEWLEDERFATPTARMANVAALVGLLDQLFAADSWEAWRARLDAGGVTFGVVGKVGDHISDPQVLANDLLPEFEDGYGLRTVDSPFQVEGVEKLPPKMAPAIGQHTREILAECGLAAAQIEALSGAG
jgi:crotonobetainyl-CoA:carnitine CoA-transferase CaiB-like acyl-CoA transferase